MMNILSTDFQVCVKIYEYNIKDEKIWYSRLNKNMSLSQQTISRAIDRLEDCRLVERRWEHLDGKWAYALYITDDAKPFVRSLYYADKDWVNYVYKEWAENPQARPVGS